jgi:hypothetical protein
LEHGILRDIAITATDRIALATALFVRIVMLPAAFVLMALYMAVQYIPEALCQSSASMMII